MWVAYLNLTDNGQQCPSGLEQRTISNTTVTCGIRGGGSGCSTVDYPINTIHPHTRVCGKVFGRVIDTPDGFATSGTLTLDSNYVDGVSLTHGEPRQHIWTFAADEVKENCPCLNSPPSFINDEHFFCANRSSNPAWDGKNGCLTNNPPWFHRELSALTTDDIELRLCRDEGRENEDIGVTHIELYVQ